MSNPHTSPKTEARASFLDGLLDEAAEALAFKLASFFPRKIQSLGSFVRRLNELGLVEEVVVSFGEESTSSIATAPEEIRSMFQVLCNYVSLTALSRPTSFHLAFLDGTTYSTNELREWVDAYRPQCFRKTTKIAHTPASEQHHAVYKALISLGFTSELKSLRRYGKKIPPEHPGPPEEQLPNAFDHNQRLLKALAEAGVSDALRELVAQELTAKATSESPTVLFPKLTAAQLAAIKKHAEKRPWAKRREFGYAWRTDVFDFVAKEYKKWIPGLTQADLSVDDDLYLKFARETWKRGLPDGLDVPTEHEATLRRITDPIERLKYEAVRNEDTLRKRRQRENNL